MRRKFVTFLMCWAVVMPMLSQVSLVHPWSGKRVAYFGDSITDPRVRSSEKKFWGFLQDWLQITPLVYGVSGRQWDDIPRQANKLREEHGTDFDAIVIFMGTNDYNNAVPIGEWYDERMEQVEYGHRYTKRMEHRMRRTPIMTDETYKGRINIAMDSLKRMFPTKQIVLLTPLHRGGFYANDSNWQCTEDYCNRCGEYLDAYVDAVKEAGSVWAVPVIDLGALSGLFPMVEEHKRYFAHKETDALHPNQAGHKRMAQTLMYQLIALPCTLAE